MQPLLKQILQLVNLFYYQESQVLIQNNQRMNHKNCRLEMELILVHLIN